MAPVLSSRNYDPNSIDSILKQLADVANVGPNVINGTSQFLFNSYAPQNWELAQGNFGSAAITTAGPSVKISRTENLSASLFANPVDNEGNATLALYSVGMSTSGMQTCALWAASKGAMNFDTVAITGLGMAFGTSTGKGTGAYLEGRRNTATAGIVGTEIRANNQTTTPISFAGNFGFGGALWLSSSGQSGASSNNGFACGIIAIAGSQFDVGVAAISGSIKTTFLRDDSSASVSYTINGSHNYGLDMTGATLGVAPIAAPLITPASSSAPGKAGAIVWDAGFIYVCTATNTWKRAALSTF